MITPLLWAALQIAAAPSMSATPWPMRTVHTVPSLGPLVLADSPNPELTAVRVFAPLAPEFRGSDEARVLIELANLRGRPLALRAGIQFSASLAPDGVVYTATGSNTDIDHVFAVLSHAIRVPDDDAFAYTQASRPVWRQREVASETGGGWILASLSSRLCEGAQPLRLNDGASGATASQRLGERTRALWGRSHVAPLPVVTIVSTLTEAVLFAGLDLIRSSLPEVGAGSSLEAAEALPTPRAPSLLRTWYGTAHPLPDSAVSEALVAGELLDDAVASSSGESELFAEIRSTACGKALFVWGSAFPRDVRAMRARVLGFLPGFGDSVDESTVARAANRVLLRLLAHADTPAGRAAAVASFYEGRHPLDDVAGELRRIDRHDVVSFLATLTDENRLTAQVGR